MCVRWLRFCPRHPNSPPCMRALHPNRKTLAYSMHATMWLLLCSGIDPLAQHGKSLPESVTTLSQTVWNRSNVLSVTRANARNPDSVNRLFFDRTHGPLITTRAFPRILPIGQVLSSPPFPISQLPDRKDKVKCKNMLVRIQWVYEAKW